MERFEVGKRYVVGGIAYEITGRTEKTIKFVDAQHAGRFNERKSNQKKAKICDWSDREVFMVSCHIVEAI